MAYSAFTLPESLHQFGLRRLASPDLFPGVTPVSPSPALAQHLAENTGYALNLNTEKARSELLIMPILLDVRRQTNYRISIHSGADFTVAPEQGLSGFCDYLVSASAEALFLESPVLAVVEAKKENIREGYGQCIAEIVAARLFNEQASTPRETLYGAVTTGDVWSFLTLAGSEVTIEEGFRYLDSLEEILGILMHIVR
jgi:hypothetical protein